MGQVKFEQWIYPSESNLRRIGKECCLDDVHRDLLIKKLVERNLLIYGDTHQSEDFRCTPVFNDGYLSVSMRTWGEIMSEAFCCKNNLGSGIPFYNYQDFYIVSIGRYREKLPVE